MSNIVEDAQKCVTHWRAMAKESPGIGMPVPALNMIGVADMIDGLLAEIARLRLTDAERESLEADMIDSLLAEIARLRLTDAERESLERAAVWLMTLAKDRRESDTVGECMSAVYLADDAATLRGLLERLK